MEIGPINEKVVIEHNLPETKVEEKKISNVGTINKDSAEISLEGRKKLSQLADNYLQEAVENGEKIDSVSARIERIRNRVETGFYDSDEVKEKITSKLADDIIADVRQIRKKD